MTPDVKMFIAEHWEKLQGRVLEVGAYNVNGGIRDFVDIEVGVDMRPGPGVDVVCKAEDLPNVFPHESFDAVVSCETFEHIEFWREALQGMWAVLKPDGWLVMTMASIEKRRHNHPNDYWRMEARHLAQIFPGVEFRQLGGVSVGWAVQKKGDLPDLTNVELIPVP